MQLIMLDGGAAYLTRSQQNRSRMIVSHFALGGGSNYTPSKSTSAFKTPILYKARIDSQQVSGDTAVFTCIIPAGVAVTAGEIAILSPEGGFVAMAVVSTLITKTLGSEMQLTLELSTTGLGEQMLFVSNKVFLSRTRPDFDDILLQMQSAAWDRESWSGLVTNETGTTLLELMSGIGEFDAYMFESALQEAFPDTAKLNSSQYAIQNMLGNRLTRKAPAGADFSAVRTTTGSSLIIPPYTQWQAAGKNLFNREAVSFNVGQSTKAVRLYEGEIVSTTIQGLSLDYQFWVSPQDKFTVSDQDVLVNLGSTKVPVVYDPLWGYSGKPAVQDKTDKTGRLQLSFGDATLATRPALTDVVTITYAVTAGSQGNDSSFSGQKATCYIVGLTATATTPLTGGGDQPSVTLYQRMGGDLFGGQLGAVTPSQYRARAREYPGVLDAVVLAQRDLAPMNKDYFNVGKIILLTQQPWSTADKEAYELWYRRRTMYSMRYQIVTGDPDLNEEPRQKQVNVKVRISCRNDADLVDIQARAEGATRKLFVPRAGILSRDLYMTDITDAIKSVSPELIDFVELDTPDDDVIMDIYTPKVTVSVQAGVGTIPPGNYVYGVAAIDADGKTAPDLIRATTVDAMSTVTLVWDHIPAATGYVIYGRTAPFGEIDTVVAVLGQDTYTYVDTGTVVGTGAPAESINTSGIHYSTLGTLDIAVSYSRRRLIEDSGFSQ